MNSSDAIARAAAGDDAARQALYETHHAAAFRLAYLLVQDPDDAEEVVQDAFAYLFRNLHRYDAEKGSFWAWLRVTLVSRCRNKRRRKRLALVPLENLEAAGRPLPDPRPTSDPARVMEASGARRAVWEALQRISPAAREATVLRYYQGLSYAEIAAILGCSPDAARARVAHAKLQLRRLLLAQEEQPAARRGVESPAEVG